MKFQFCVARLVLGPRPKTAELSLRFRPPNQEHDIITSDPVLVAFCYPLGPESQTPKEYMAPEEYTFTLTQSTGERVQGFCRRFLPPSSPRATSKLRYPQVICLLTEAPWTAFFFKVLQIIEQLLRQSQLLVGEGQPTLPSSSLAGKYLHNLVDQLATMPPTGHIIRCPIPNGATALSVSPPRRLSIGGVVEPPLQCTSEFVELQVPPECGNGTWNCGVSMARLLWHVPVPAMLTLIASMLMERRVILVSQSRDMVSAAVNAAQAFLYPFRWHHIYLPLLPKQLKDYLQAPMPFLIGMPAQLLPILKGISMNEVTMIDLDLGKCEPVPGSEHDRLEHALTEAKENLRSPTEYESNAFIAGIMLEYYLKLMGNYRRFVSERPVHSGGSSSEPSTPSSRAAVNRNGLPQDSLIGEGNYFDHAAFVAAHRGGERARRFLTLFRHSQMYEMFIQERLTFAKTCWAPDTLDSFELRVAAQDAKRNRMRRIAGRLNAEYKRAASRVAEVVRQATAGVERMLTEPEEPTAKRTSTSTSSTAQVGAGSLAAQYEMVAGYFKDDDSDGDSEASVDIARSSPSTQSLPDLSSDEGRLQRQLHTLPTIHSTPTMSSVALGRGSAPVGATASSSGWAAGWGMGTRPQTPAASEGRSSTSEHGDFSLLINLDEAEAHHGAAQREGSTRGAPPSLPSILDTALGSRNQAGASSNTQHHPLASPSSQPSHPLQRSGSQNRHSVPPLPLQYTGGGTPVPQNGVTEFWSSFRTDVADAWQDFSSVMGSVAANVRSARPRSVAGSVSRSDSRNSNVSDTSKPVDPFSTLLDLRKPADKAAEAARVPRISGGWRTSASAGSTPRPSDPTPAEPPSTSMPSLTVKTSTAVPPVHDILASAAFADPLGVAAPPVANGITKPSTNGYGGDWDPFDVLASTGPAGSSTDTQKPQPTDPLGATWDPFLAPAASNGSHEAPGKASTGASVPDTDPFGMLAAQVKLTAPVVHMAPQQGISLIDL